jgi:hypothetical protein
LFDIPYSISPVYGIMTSSLCFQFENLAIVLMCAHREFEKSKTAPSLKIPRYVTPGRWRGRQQQRLRIGIVIVMCKCVNNPDLFDISHTDQIDVTTELRYCWRPRQQSKTLQSYYCMPAGNWRSQKQRLR